MRDRIRGVSLTQAITLAVRIRKLNVVGNWHMGFKLVAQPRKNRVAKNGDTVWVHAQFSRMTYVAG